MIRGESSPGSCGFTLLELLVAMAVLSLMVVLIGQIISFTNSTISGFTRRLDVGVQSRFVLDRLGSDLEASLRRPDVPFEAIKQEGNDFLRFYSEVDGYTGTRRVATVGYEIMDTDGNLELMRGVEGAGWSEGPGVKFQEATVPAIGPSNYDVLAENIFRFELSFLKQDGTLQTTADPALGDVYAIVVTVAGLDGKTRKILTKDQIKTLADVLPDAVDAKEPMNSWEASGVRNGVAGIPLQATQAIRFYQRYYHVR